MSQLLLTKKKEIRIVALWLGVMIGDGQEFSTETENEGLQEN